MREQATVPADAENDNPAPRTPRVVPWWIVVLVAVAAVGTALAGYLIITHDPNAPGTTHRVTLVRLDATCGDGRVASGAVGVQLSEHSIWFTMDGRASAGTVGTLHIDQPDFATFHPDQGVEVALGRASSLPVAAYPCSRPG